MQKNKANPPAQRHSGGQLPVSGSAAALARPAGERIAKVVARAGLCSRREAEAWIAAGRVASNGVTLTSPAVGVHPGDQITVDGKPLCEREPTRLFLFHKSRGLVTSARDPQGRPTVFDYLREHWQEGPRLVSIGRLDINSEGLLLLTNDGGLARVLELPSTGWARRYRVRAKGSITQSALDELHKGIRVEGIDYAGIEAKLDRIKGANCWLTMALREGKNREIKRVLGHLGLRVNRLIRLSYGPFQLGGLGEGEIKEVPGGILHDQLGKALIEAAGVKLPGRHETRRKTREERPRHSSPPSHRTKARREGGKGAAAEITPKPKHRPKPGPRKHISLLREEGQNSLPARKRIERGEVAGRTGQTIAVERLVSPVKWKEEPRGGQSRRTAEANRFRGSSSTGEAGKTASLRQGKKPRVPRRTGQKRLGRGKRT